MRIVIDMQGAQTGSRFRGIGRYTISLVKEILKNRGEHEVILALNGLLSESIESIRAAFNDLIDQENIKVWNAIGEVQEVDPRNNWRREISEIIREDFLIDLNPDIVLLTSLFEGFGDDAVTSVNLLSNNFYTAVILYDLIPLMDSKNYFQNTDYERHYRRKISSLRESDIFLSISEYTLKESLDNLDLDESRICNISAACDEIFKPIVLDKRAQGNLTAKYGINRDFVLYSGGADPRKNLHRLIEAYSKISTKVRNGCQLVLVGKVPESIQKELNHSASKFALTEDDFLLVGYVPDEDLIALMSLSKLFVFPSLYEGFGLPVLEAMSCGAPVISSNQTSLPEVIGNVEAQFDPLDINQMSQKMERVICDENFRNQLINHGVEFSKNFSWSCSARKTIKFFEQVLILKDENILCSRDSVIDGIAEKLSKNSVDNKEIVKIAHSISLNQYEVKGCKQLLIDISELNVRDSRTGIQRVTRSILKNLLEIDFKEYLIRPVYASMDSSGYKYANNYLNKMNGNDFCVEDEVIEYRSGDIFLGLDLQSHVVVKQKDFLMGLKLKGVKVLFVLYDLLPVLMPNFFREKEDFYHQRWLETLECFDGILCISNSVAEEYQDWQKLNGKDRLRPFTIDWFHLGADIDSSLPSKGLLPNAHIVLSQLASSITFLMVGTIEPRKGHKQVLDAFNLIWNKYPEVNLVLVGQQGWNIEGVVEQINTHPLLNKKLFWFNGISDEYLEKVYNTSNCLIAGSYGEGFGLPLIEAAQHKLPIIARDIPVFREVAGEHAYYFKADEPSELASAIQDWLVLYEKNQHPTSVNMPWLTWEQSAQQLLNIVLD